MDRSREISILHLNTAKSWRGGEKQTYHLVLELYKRGYKSFCICQKNSILQYRLRERNIPHRSIRMGSEFDLIAAIRIARIAKELRTEILHMHTAHAHSLGLLTNLFYKIPINIVSRRVDFRVRENLFSRLKYNYPAGFIAVSNAIRDILIEDGISEEKVTTIYSGVNLEMNKKVETDYLFREFSNIYDLKKRVKLVNVAALTHQKDQETLIRAVQILIRSYNNIVLFIVGEGELKDCLLQLSKSAGLEDYILFTGFRDDPLNLIELCDIFVISSRWEGLGTSIIDAMALRKPIVASRTGGIPELIRDGIDGILVEKENPKELANAILKLIYDKGLQRRMSDEAYKRSSDFSIKSTVDKTIGLYNDFLT